MRKKNLFFEHLINTIYFFKLRNTSMYTYLKYYNITRINMQIHKNPRSSNNILTINIFF